jgi:hydroxymethylglutaryl-CoA reductase (NADPH)
MTSELNRIRAIIDQLHQTASAEEWRRRLAPDLAPAPPRIRNARHITDAAAARRWNILRERTAADADDQSVLLDPDTARQKDLYERNIENFVGTVKLPVGVAGPLRINGTHAKGDYYVPLATSEAALVASYHRGALLLTEAGGCTTGLLNEGVSRSPGFVFRSLAEAGEFVLWATGNFDTFKQVAESTTRFGKLIDMYVTVEGNHVYLGFEYTTGDAAGQNMVTIATEAICQYVTSHSPVPPQHMFVEANMSGDKKATALSFLSVRGKKVSAEAVIGRDLVRAVLHTSPETMSKCWQMAAVGGVMSGTMGIQGHYANGLSAVYIATGQDAACVSESAVGITRMEVTPDGDLYASVTLPNLIVGTVGGGTSLPSQRACLRIADSDGAGHASSFAEVCAALCLAGELSISGALAAGEFTEAHRRLARGRFGNGAASSTG